MKMKLLTVLLGVVGSVFPRRVIEVSKTMALGPSYRNTEDLEPRQWFVTAVRIQSLLVLLAGVYALRRSDGAEFEVPSKPTLTPMESDTESEEE
ncbi:hypothetical protein [Halodesulfurarchaeum formicicum]|uniref:DUF6199 domain-containing protein n=2 Tax=Halodesulfurarchaeum formicicum TaxID=1873524 RepID=A0A1J1AC63_9EURY|nr:hypothetical protein [Halodesulfurarchaeum formicicum]APE95738.1 hypothetical protein HSR6_1294 [Halodesulfurarchaeum formicicum]